MNLSPSRCSDPEEIKRLIRAAGAVAVGIARADRLTDSEIDAYDRWIADGCAAGMDYLSRYPDQRSDPRLLLEGAESVIVAAFPYDGALVMPSPGGLTWARYAVGDDYHDVIRARLSAVATQLEGKTRVCVDTAPIRERLWAVRAGIGFIGFNGQLIVPGAGSYMLLGEILSTLPLTPDQSLHRSCLGCGRCLKACPGQALSIGPDGKARLDARRCLSYLTIERKGDNVIPLPDSHIYGCDVCQEVCPHNHEQPLPPPLPEFQARPEVMGLSRPDILAMKQEDFSAIFRRSAIKRAKLAGLQRNALGLSADL